MIFIIKSGNLNFQPELLLLCYSVQWNTNKTYKLLTLKTITVLILIYVLIRILFQTLGNSVFISYILEHWKPIWLAHIHLQYYDLMEKDFSFSLFPLGVSCNIHTGTEAWEETWHQLLATEMFLCLQNSRLSLCISVNSFSSTLLSSSAPWFYPLVGGIY